MKFLHTHLRGHFHNKKHNRFDLLFLFVAPGSDVDVFVCLFSFFNFTFCSRWLRFFSIILFTKNLYIIVLNCQLEMTQNKRRLCRTSIYIVTFRATVKILFGNWQNIDEVIHLPTNKFPKSDMASVSSLSLLVVEGLKQTGLVTNCTLRRQIRHTGTEVCETGKVKVKFIKWFQVV